MSGSRVITILRFLLWRHGGQKAIFPICFHLKSKSSSPDIFSIFYIVEMKLGRSWDQSSNFTKIWILKISVTGSRCFWRHYDVMWAKTIYLHISATTRPFVLKFETMGISGIRNSVLMAECQIFEQLHLRWCHDDVIYCYG